MNKLIYRLDVKMAVYEDSFLLRILANTTNDYWWEVENLTLDVLLAERDRVGLYAKLPELSLDPSSHPVDILTARSVSTDTVNINER